MGTKVGTPYYVAPEVLNKNIPRVVIYGLLVLLHIYYYVDIHPSMVNLIIKYLKVLRLDALIFLHLIGILLVMMPNILFVVYYKWIPIKGILYIVENAFLKK